jgi:UDP-GlcNAc3NAcA epimerase
MTGRMIEEIEKILIDYQPDWVLVYGDTNSTLAGAIAASKLNIKIAHIEAGLRSNNNEMPEEINRIITDRVSNILFCPTNKSITNLKNEGVEYWKDTKYFLSGDIMLESTNHFKNLSLKPGNILIKKNFILTTVHRAENTNDPEKLSNIFEALRHISKECQVILPLHPRTDNIIKQNNINMEGITIIPPVGYLNMTWLLSNCSTVITDSGGLQKEAYFHEKPCLTLREETEWSELVENGVNVLSGWRKSDILDSFKKVLLIPENKFSKQLYGDGNCSAFILEKLINY